MIYGGESVHYHDDVRVDGGTLPNPLCLFYVCYDVDDLVDTSMVESSRNSGTDQLGDDALDMDMVEVLQKKCNYSQCLSHNDTVGWSFFLDRE